MLGAGRVLVLALALPGCASVLSTFTPAPTTPAGSVRAAAAVGVSAPVGQLVEIAEQGEDLADKQASGQALTAGEQDALVEAALALVLNPPSAAGEVQGRYGITEHVDVGVRMASSLTARVDGRWQFVDAEEDGFAASAGLGLGYYAKSFEIPNRDIELVVGVADLVRVELDAPLLFGWSGDVGHFWFGPKLVVNRYWADVRLAFLNTPIAEGTASGTNFFYGAQLGGALGYKYVWVAAELSIMQLASSASIEANDYSADLSFGGLVLYPAFGLIVQI